MMQSKDLSMPATTAGDAAVSGLLSGLIAGSMMALFLAATGLASGENPLEILGRFGPGAGSTPLVGLALHLAVSGIYGILFAVGCCLTAQRWGFRSSTWVACAVGTAYGVLLWLLAQTILLPEAGSALRAFPAWQFALAHLIYGVVLGVLAYRSRQHEVKAP